MQHRDLCLHPGPPRGARHAARHWPAVEVILFSQWTLEPYEADHLRILKCKDEAHGTWTFTCTTELVDERLHTHTHGARLKSSQT
eukprot:2705963-Amphidinium_carterae.1